MLAAIEGSGLAYPTLPQLPIYCFNPEASEKEELELAGWGRAGGAFMPVGLFRSTLDSGHL